MVLAVCSNTVLLELTYSEVEVELLVANEVASGLRLELCVCVAFAGLADNCFSLLLGQTDEWCLPPHLEHLQLERQSLLI